MGNKSSLYEGATQMSKVKVFGKYQGEFMYLVPLMPVDSLVYAKFLSREQIFAGLALK